MTAKLLAASRAVSNLMSYAIKKALLAVFITAVVASVVTTGIIVLIVRIAS